MVGAGAKSGIYWALDAATGEVRWSAALGPGLDPRRDRAGNRDLFIPGWTGSTTAGTFYAFSIYGK